MMKSYILIDGSGSMHTRWVETIGAVNAYVEALGEDKATKKADVTVAVFDSQEPFKVVRKDVKVKDWTPIAVQEFTPRAMTPLLDSIGILNQTITLAKPKKASIVIVTDGLENASREITKDGAKIILDNLRGKGYEVVFIGADFDAFGQSGGLGNSMGQTLNMYAGGYEGAFRSMAMKSATYASTGMVRDFTDQERSVAAGK
jgi:Mg-chelatase subunit ChlD